jgi:hypothetical protein
MDATLGGGKDGRTKFKDDLTELGLLYLLNIQ